MPDWRYWYEVLEYTSCFVCCIAGARYYGVYGGHHPLALLQLTLDLFILAQLQWCTQMCQVGYLVFHDIFYQQEHFRPRKEWQRTSYSVCKILCVSAIVYVVSDPEQTNILMKKSICLKNESNNMTKICIHIHVCMLAEISSCSARLVASW